MLRAPAFPGAISFPPKIFSSRLRVAIHSLKDGSMRSVRDLVSPPLPPGDTPPCPYCIGENAAGIMILFTWITNWSIPPPGGHKPCCTAWERMAARCSRLL
jgi:hypothetical protein